jgi:hypothetical protein
MQDLRRPCEIETCIDAMGRDGQWSGRCHDELWSSTFYEPPHDITHRQASPWQVALARSVSTAAEFDPPYVLNRSAHTT